MKKILKLLALSFISIINVKAQIQFNEIIQPFDSYDAVSQSSISFADVDNDGDQDVLITGARNSSPNRIARLYTNDGTGFFSLVTGTPFAGVSYSALAFADVDGDGDQDVLITGSTAAIHTARLYTNDGTGTYSLVSGTPFTGVNGSSIAFADIDGDGDQDVIISGANWQGKMTELYTNDGTGTFSLVTNTPFDAVSAGSIAFSDIDADGDQDVLITGHTGTLSISKLYTNNGTGNFTLVTGTPFNGVSGSSVAFSDIDGDGDQDVVINGYTGTLRQTKLYTNNGTGTFSLVAGTSFDAVSSGSLSFSDVDGDGDQDLLITGFNGTISLNKLYANDGLGNYTVVSGTPFPGVYSSSLAFSDIDGDGDQDFLITGRSPGRITKVYRNNTCFVSSVDVQVVCGSHTWIDGNTYSTNNNTATHTIVGGSTLGCDSVVTLDLTINTIYCTYVPDNNFEAYLETHDAFGNLVVIGAANSMGNGIANDDYVTTAMIDTVKVLSVSSLNILDLMGIEDFAQLVTLNVGSNYNIVFDLTSNTSLENLYCHSSNIASANLDLSQNIALKNLFCQNNQLNTLDLSANVNLESVNCFLNNLTAFDVSGNPLLTSLFITNNPLTSLNVANGNNINFTLFSSVNNPNLLCIQVDNAAYSDLHWTNIDAIASFNHNCANLETYVPDNNFEEYLETHNAAGTFVGPNGAGNMGNGIANDDYVTTANINTVTNLNISYKNIADITGIEDFAALENLNARNNNLTTVDISDNSQLLIINFLYNDLTGLDVSQNILLTSIITHHNNLTSLDISNNLQLGSLDCRVNNLSSLDLSNPLLVWVHCSDNGMNTLTTGNNTSLTTLYCHNNTLTNLDFSGNTSLGILQANNNQLTSLNMKNGNNVAIAGNQFQSQTNPNLLCIEVDDAAYSTNTWYSRDPVSSFSENCGVVNWTGTTSTDWFTATNWANGVVPTSTDEVIIPDVSAASNNFPVIATAITLGDITVDANASLDLVTGIELDGTFTNNGTVTLQDGAYLDDFTNATSAFVGNITVETTAANGVTNDQRFIASPVNTPNISEIGDDLISPWSTGLTGTNNVAVTVNCNTGSLTSSSNYGNLFELEESLAINCALESWVVRSSGSLENARGYSAYLANGSTFDFTGVPNTGNINLNVTNSGSGIADAEGWNLVGNPYPSPISRDDVTNAGLTDAVYFVTSGVYQGSFFPYLPGSNIAVAQGFQAHTNSNTTVTLDNSFRNTGVSTWYQNGNWFEHKLEVSVFGNGFGDKTILFYNQNATNGYEALYDVKKFKSNAGQPSISLLNQSEELALNGMSVNDIGETVPMHLDAGTDGTFTLSFEGMNTFPANTTIYVKDLQENVVHNIANGDYSFSATTNDNVARFEIIFIPEVEFLTTKVDCDGNEGSVQLLNTNFASNRSFEIINNSSVIASNNLVNLNESLAKGIYTINVNDQYGGTQVYTIKIEAAELIEAEFTVSNTELNVGEMLMLNNTSSNSTIIEWLIDNTSISNLNNFSYSFDEAGIYDLVMNVSNEDCADTKSTLVKVLNKTTGISDLNDENISIYPNPVKNELKITLKTDTRFSILSSNGKVVREGLLQNGENVLNVSEITNGFYIIKLETNEGFVTKKLIKN